MCLCVKIKQCANKAKLSTEACKANEEGDIVFPVRNVNISFLSVIDLHKFINLTPSKIKWHQFRLIEVKSSQD